MWASLTPSLLKCLYQDRKVSKFISITFEMFVSRQESERVYLCHFWNVCSKTGKWTSLSLSLLKCLYQDRKVSDFISVTFEMFVSRQENERVYLCHFWNVCSKTGKWTSLSLSLLKCLYQDRKVSEFISITFEMFVSRQESERVLYLCVSVIYIVLCLRYFYWILDLFWLWHLKKKKIFHFSIAVAKKKKKKQQRI